MERGLEQKVQGAGQVISDRRQLLYFIDIHRFKNKWAFRTGRGEWWMLWTDFLYYFDIVSMVRKNTWPWSEKRVMGVWTPRQNRSQYILRMFKKTQVRIALSQCHR